MVPVLVAGMCPRIAPAILPAVLTVPIVVTGELHGTHVDATTVVTGQTPATVATRAAGTTVVTAVDAIPGAAATILGTASEVPLPSAGVGPGTVKREHAVQSPILRTDEVRVGAAVVARKVAVKIITNVVEAHLLNFVYYLM